MDKYTLNRDESILLIIDIQERLAPAMKYEERVIKNTDILIRVAEEMDMPILVTEQYPKGLGATVSEISDNLKGAQVFEKVLFSVCTDDFIRALERRERKKIIVVGMETHVCVLQSVRELLKLDYNVFVVSDAISSRFEENHSNGLDLMRDMGAVITNTETVLFDLLKEAGTSEFRVLSKLIR
ncbi:MAG: hydrolase [Tissierellia bacterium]|nr:hydrolase [Tissierellia bacterium]